MVPEPSPTQPPFSWWIDDFIFFRGMVHTSGWAFHPTRRIVQANWQLPGGEQFPLDSFGLESPDVEGAFGVAAARCRFSGRLSLAKVEEALTLRLVFVTDSGERFEVVPEHKLSRDPFHQLASRFFEQLRQRSAGRALELGSRSRSGNVQRDRVPSGWEYVGMDIKDGGNVDVVGDAHALSHLFPRDHFDAVFGTSVFEHLIMPWKAVLEMNRILKPGGLVFIATHQTFPLHERPWDFFRFSDQGWHGLFNRFTGFEILDTTLGEPASVVPRLLHRVIAALDTLEAFVGSAVLARKVADSQLSWEVDPEALVRTPYPH